MLAFGVATVDGYLRALSRATSPMRAFDALFGLTTLALGNPRDAVSIRAATHALLAEEPPAELRWHGGTRSGLGTRSALVRDAIVISDSGHVVGLSMLPFVVSTRIEEHFPRARTLRLLLEPNARAQAEVLSRTGVGETSPAARVLH